MISAYSRGVGVCPGRFTLNPVCAFRVINPKENFTYFPYLDFEEFKKSLGEEAEGVTDAQIEELRTIGYKFADAVFEQWLRKRNGAAAKPQ